MRTTTNRQSSLQGPPRLKKKNNERLIPLKRHQITGCNRGCSSLLFPWFAAPSQSAAALSGSHRASTDSRREQTIQHQTPLFSLPLTLVNLIFYPPGSAIHWARSPVGVHASILWTLQSVSWMLVGPSPPNPIVTSPSSMLDLETLT